MIRYALAAVFGFAVAMSFGYTAAPIVQCGGTCELELYGCRALRDKAAAMIEGLERENRRLRAVNRDLSSGLSSCNRLELCTAESCAAFHPKICRN